MLSRHPEACRFPHGHTRTIEVVVSADALDENGMVLDFKALKLAIGDHLDRYDHAMAVHSADPLLPAMREVYPPEALLVFEDVDPTTEAMAKEIYDFVASVLSAGFATVTGRGVRYAIPAGRVRLERVRVWETPTSWAEYASS